MLSTLGLSGVTELAISVGCGSGDSNSLHNDFSIRTVSQGMISLVSSSELVRPEPSTTQRSCSIRLVLSGSSDALLGLQRNLDALFTQGTLEQTFGVSCDECIGSTCVCSTIVSSPTTCSGLVRVRVLDAAGLAYARLHGIVSVQDIGTLTSPMVAASSIKVPMASTSSWSINLPSPSALTSSSAMPETTTCAIARNGEALSLAAVMAGNVLLSESVSQSSGSGDRLTCIFGPVMDITDRSTQAPQVYVFDALDFDATATLGSPRVIASTLPYFELVSTEALVVDVGQSASIPVRIRGADARPADLAEIECRVSTGVAVGIGSIQ